MRLYHSLHRRANVDADLFAVEPIFSRLLRRGRDRQRRFGARSDRPLRDLLDERARAERPRLLQDLDLGPVRLTDRLDLEGVQVHHLLLLAADVDLRGGARGQAWKIGVRSVSAVLHRNILNHSGPSQGGLNLPCMVSRQGQ